MLVARLSGQQYHADNTSSWAREIADEIKNKLKGTFPSGGSSSGCCAGSRTILSGLTSTPQTRLHVCDSQRRTGAGTSLLSKFSFQSSMAKVFGECGLHARATLALYSKSLPIPVSLPGWHVEGSGIPTLTTMRMTRFLT